ncbi:hypothetical protein HBE96_21940 [Clostridium sp. P21]|uniref:Uncharacterized protein n=1 Tax=Clostridium muellerianum TaxID=2716538 RepID=A0A7Y0HPN5_9CLOT|nr:hypothetical protein [Clostridium muellerianum]NMM65249.1 hypothetical protein [Clostridium muellerianum]
MPIKAKREILCEKCGKKIIVVCNDDITIENLKKLNDKLCLKCKITSILKLRVKGE